MLSVDNMLVVLKTAVDALARQPRLNEADRTALDLCEYMLGLFVKERDSARRAIQEESCESLGLATSPSESIISLPNCAT
jgi:hypothetical protein